MNTATTDRYTALQVEFARQLADDLEVGVVRDVLVAGTGRGTWYVTGVDVAAGLVAVHRHGVRRTVRLDAVS
jgi:hypothetical protein